MQNKLTLWGTASVAVVLYFLFLIPETYSYYNEVLRKLKETMFYFFKNSQYH